MNVNTSPIIKTIVYFLLSAILTGIFIANKFWFYSSVAQMILSGAIAAGKWLIQIIVVLVFLKEKKWEFLKRMGLVCLIGSCVLFSYHILFYLPLPLSGFSLFVLSILSSISVMVGMYYRAVSKSNLPAKWFWGWMLCLCIAIILQLTLVF